MEHVTVSLNGERYDEVLHRSNCPPECGDLEVIVKREAMVSRNAAVCFTFSVMIDGKKTRVQAVTTLKLMKRLFASIPDDGN